MTKIAIIFIVLIIILGGFLIYRHYNKKDKNEKFDLNIVPLLPNLVGMSYNDASTELQRRRINFSFAGNERVQTARLNNKVSRQEPSANSPYNNNTVVKLYVGQYQRKVDTPAINDVGEQKIKEKIKEFQGSDDKKRLATPRNINQNIITFLGEDIVSDKQYDWSENVFGLTCDGNHFYICTENRNRLQYTPINSDDTLGNPEVLLRRRSVFGDYEYAYPTPLWCENGKYGQGHTLFKKDRDGDERTIFPIKGCTMQYQNGERKQGTYLSERLSGRLFGTVAFVENMQLDWVAYDPLSKFYFLPANGQTLDRMSVIDLMDAGYDYATDTNNIVRYVKSVTLKLNGSPYILRNVSAACFSKNGMFYALCNGNSEQPQGVYMFWLHYTGDYFELVKYLPLKKYEEERVPVLGIGLGDTQRYVGITCRDMGSYNNLYVLHRNDDIVSTDNITLVRFRNVW